MAFTSVVFVAMLQKVRIDNNINSPEWHIATFPPLCVYYQRSSFLLYDVFSSPNEILK